MSEAKMTSKGQITLPKEIRLKLKLRQGDRVRFVVDEDGSVRLMPAKRDISSLIGILPPPKRRMSIEEIDEALSLAVARHVLGHDRD